MLDCGILFGNKEKEEKEEKISNFLIKFCEQIKQPFLQMKQ